MEYREKKKQKNNKWSNVAKTFGGGGKRSRHCMRRKTSTFQGKVVFSQNVTTQKDSTTCGREKQK